MSVSHLGVVIRIVIVIVLPLVNLHYSTNNAVVVDDYGNRLIEIGSESSHLTDNCMRCLCAASSDCKTNARCHSIEPYKRLCGPFRITEQYWNIAGNLTLSTIWPDNNPLDFEMCAHNLECSIKTVTKLINTFFSECGLFEATNHGKRSTTKYYCTLAAFVHYRQIYQADSNEDYDIDTEQQTLTDSSSSSSSGGGGVSSIRDTAGDDYDVDGNDDYDDDSEPNQSALFCDINISNIDEEIEKMYRTAPATRSDDKFWNRFEECSQQFPV